jgi:predicted acetyltransferase
MPGMEPPAVALEPAAAEHAGVIENLLELYIHDLSAAFEVEIGDDGRFGYPRLARYWSEPERHHAFLFRVAGQLAGFALVARGSPATEDSEHLDVVEFFVLRRYRRFGVGSTAAMLLWDQLPGHWVVRVAECNADAQPFWRALIARYSHGRGTERRVSHAGKGWSVFEFDSPAFLASGS